MSVLPEIESRFDVLAKLGEGGMGTVYKVRHRDLDEVQIVKTLKAHLSSKEGLRERFVNEARRGMRLRHPHIAGVHDFAVCADGTGYIVMEYVHGHNLRDLLATQRPDAAAARRRDRRADARRARLSPQREVHPSRHLARQPDPHHDRGREAVREADRPRHLQIARGGTDDDRNGPVHRQGQLRVARTVRRTRRRAQRPLFARRRAVQAADERRAVSRRELQPDHRRPSLSAAASVRGSRARNRDPRGRAARRVSRAGERSGQALSRRRGVLRRGRGSVRHRGAEDHAARANASGGDAARGRRDSATTVVPLSDKTEISALPTAGRHDDRRRRRRSRSLRPHRLARRRARALRRRGVRLAADAGRESRELREVLRRRHRRVAVSKTRDRSRPR